ILELPDAAAHRYRHEAMFGGAGDDVEDGFAPFGARRDVEEAEFVGAGRVVGDGGFHRVAGVAQIDKLYALDDAPVLHVEAGDQSGLEGHRASAPVLPLSKASASRESMRPSYRARPEMAPA